MKFSVIRSLVATATVASAHTIMQAVNDLEMGKGIYMPDNDNTPIQDVSTDSIACSGPPVKKWRSSPDVIEVKAGETVTGLWLHELGSTGADMYADNKVIASSHHGPVLAYLKKVDDATNNPAAGPGDGWFKIAEMGYDNQVWGVDTLIQDEGIQSVTIPECIEDGDYLLRFELIALHSAVEPMGAQFYLSCAQIRVSGGTASKTPETVSFPGAYSNEDPGIHVQIWDANDEPKPESYTVPGPAVFTC